MKKVIKKISWWLVLPFFCLVFLFSCKAREKQVQKSETQSEKKSEASFKIEDRTFEIVSDKELTKFDKSKINQSEETSKTETKNVEIIKEYYENGTIKKEMQRNFSELAETTKNAILELEEKISTEKENTKYWESSSNHYYSLWQQEIAKSKTNYLQVKSKPTYTWQMFFGGLFIGWLILPSVFRIIWSILKRFHPYLKLVEYLKNIKW